MIIVPSMPDEARSFPRVTDVLSIIHDGLDDFRSTQHGRLIVDDKARIGEQVHRLIKMTIKDEEFDVKDYSSEVENRYEQWKEWSEENITEYYGTEIPVWSFKYKIKGTLDAIAKVIGSIGPVILDWKNALKINDEKVSLQTMMYELMAVEMGLMVPAKQRYCVQIFEDKVPKVTVYENRAGDIVDAIQLRCLYNRFGKRS